MKLTFPWNPETAFLFLNPGSNLGAIDNDPLFIFDPTLDTGAFPFFRLEIQAPNELYFLVLEKGECVPWHPI